MRRPHRRAGALSFFPIIVWPAAEIGAFAECWLSRLLPVRADLAVPNASEVTVIAASFPDESP